MPHELETVSERDFFISYAREDEETLAKPLAAAFGARGVTFWLDRKDVGPSPNFEYDIHNGLLAARHAVMIVSRTFLEKDWPKRELDILLILEAVDERQKIITVRHGIAQSELERLAPALAQRTKISSDGGPVAVSERVIALALEHERAPHQPGTFQSGAAVFPTFYANGIFTCPSPNCTWVPDPSLDRIGLAKQGPLFTMMRREGGWYITCTSCGSGAFGPVGREQVRWLLTFLRVILWAPQEPPYLNAALFPERYLALVEKERSLTRAALTAVAHNEQGEEWLSARDNYVREIELALHMGEIDQSQYDQLSQANRRHVEEFRKALTEKKNEPGWGTRLGRIFHPNAAARPISKVEDEEALFPTSEQNRIRRDLATLFGLPPAVRGDLSADLRERIEKFISALMPLRERADYPRAQLYLGCLFYWNCKLIAVAGTDAERAFMNQAPFKSAIGVITGFFSTAEYFLDRYRAAGVGGPVEQELLQEVESWMKAIRANHRAKKEMRKCARPL